MLILNNDYYSSVTGFNLFTRIFKKALNKSRRATGATSWSVA